MWVCVGAWCLRLKRGRVVWSSTQGSHGSSREIYQLERAKLLHQELTYHTTTYCVRVSTGSSDLTAPPKIGFAETYSLIDGTALSFPQETGSPSRPKLLQLNSRNKTASSSGG